MRLIDADALLEQIVKLNNVYVQGRMAYIIDNQPTAYSVDAVVAELEEERMRYFLTIAKGGNEAMDYAYCKISNAIDRMIDLVRKGGVE